MTPSVRLVLVHGSLFGADQWLGYAARLGPGVEVVAPDLPGHGSRQDEQFTWAGALATIAEAVESGPPEQPVVLAGHSLGGYLAAAYAARAPSSLAGLALLGAAAEPTGVGAGVYRGAARAYRQLGPRRVERVLRAQLHTLGTDPEVVDALGRQGSAIDALSAAWPAVMEHGGREQLRGLRMPLLLLAGQLDQLRVGTRRLVAVVAPTADVRVAVIPRAMHVFPLTHPAATAGELARLCRTALASATMDVP